MLFWQIYPSYPKRKVGAILKTPNLFAKIVLHLRSSILAVWRVENPIYLSARAEVKRAMRAKKRRPGFINVSQEACKADTSLRTENWAL
jgi:hypothetical protein